MVCCHKSLSWIIGCLGRVRHLIWKGATEMLSPLCPSRIWDHWCFAPTRLSCCPSHQVLTVKETNNSLHLSLSLGWEETCNACYTMQPQIQPIESKSIHHVSNSILWNYFGTKERLIKDNMMITLSTVTEE